VTSWPSDQWKLGGSTVWGWLSYDPGTNLFFYGTGNPGVWNPDLRPGDNKWSSSIIARDADTGEARWAYQVTAHDSWDYDEIMENVLVDMDYGGACASCWCIQGDRVRLRARSRDRRAALRRHLPAGRTGPPVRPEDRQAAGIQPSSTTTARDARHLSVIDRRQGSGPVAFSPRTGLLYIPAHNTCMDYEGIEANYIAGTPYLGADVRMYPGPGGYQGELVAWDVARIAKCGASGREVSDLQRCARNACDVVFYGTMDGCSKRSTLAPAPSSGKFHTASGIVGNP
jgi:alcohol dehydrogenase (cytochrome c)